MMRLIENFITLLCKPLLIFYKFGSILQQIPLDYILFSDTIRNYKHFDIQAMSKKFSKQELKQRLTKQQYRVTQQNGTQMPYENEYNNCKKKGIYRCVVCGIPLFSSQLKFDSGCGWPAFFAELAGANIKKIQDKSHGMIRTQVRCSACDSHLGHIFDDGPKEKTGIRYCINSASIKLQEQI